MGLSHIQKAVLAEALLLLAVCLLWGVSGIRQAASQSVLSAPGPASSAFREEAGSSFVNQLYEETETETEDKDFIKWVDFNVTCEALVDASRYDIESHGKAIELHWIELLAILASKNGGDFSRYRSSDMKTVAEAILSGEETVETLSENLQYYGYYREAYEAVLGGMLGEYQIQVNAPQGPSWESRYGLKAFLPIAKNFPYTDYDDFGVSRSYGYARRHLGHDMMGQVGTPTQIIY